ncbi:Putative lipoyltransferase, partial [Gryllus bimaculatus]
MIILPEVVSKKCRQLYPYGSKSFIREVKGTWKQSGHKASLPQLEFCGSVIYSSMLGECGFACEEILVLVAGRMDYRTALKLQYLLASNHKNPSLCEKTNNTLVLIEHDPVYTVGIRDKSYSHEDEKKLKALGAEFHRTNRGGLITFHGPGQLVVYPIINLKEFKPSMRWYVSQLENTVIALCKKYDITASTSPHTGVWVEDRKICAIGIHGSRFVTTHGIALNCSTNLEWFSHIVPCGIEGKEVTSLTNERNELISIENAIPIFLSCFSEQFN